MDLQMQFDLFLRALTLYIEDPTPTLRLDLQHKALHLKNALCQQQMEMEQRIAEKVLQKISVRLESDDAIGKIDSLRKVVEQLGKQI